MNTENNPVIVGSSGIEMSDNPTIVGNSPEPQNRPENQLEVFSYFPSTIYTIKKPEFLHTVKSISMDALTKRKKEQPKLDPIYPLYQTDNLFNDPRISEFANYVGATGWNILQSQGSDMTNKNVFFMEMWCQEHHRHSAMDEHVHGFGAQLVGFYFLDTPADCSRVVINDPRPAKKQINLPEANMSNVTYASNSINFTPEPGLLFFANSWIPHSFSRHASAKPIRFIHFTLGVGQIPQQQQTAPTNAENGPIIV
jgi:Putative 2OG-Fe(II) oxygenase